MGKRFLLYFFLALCSVVAVKAQSNSFKSYGSGKFSETYIYNGYIKDTIVIIDSVKRDTIRKNVCCYFRHAKFINDQGLILAYMADGEGLLNSKGKLLNGPYNYGSTELMDNGYVLTGVRWDCKGNYSDKDCFGQIIFNKKGDTILYSKNVYHFHRFYSDTTLMGGFNGKTKRQEKGYILKSGNWKTIEYLDKNGEWVIATETRKQKPIKK
jgi:hypothetical protein